MKTTTEKAPKNSWEAFWKDKPGRPDAKPEMSTGMPEELTPNQLAERAASQEALKALDGGDATIKIDNGWRLLAKHVMPYRGPKEIDERDVMPPELARSWAAGWKAGCYDLDVDCPEGTPEEQRLWMAGLADGTKALMQFEKDEATRRGTNVRKAAEVTDLAEMEAIWKAHKKNGGKLSYEGIENEKSFALKWANGMTSYRIIKKYERILRNMKIAA